MKPLLRNKLNLKLYLILSAGLLFLLSFIFNKLYTSQSAAGQEAKKAAGYLHRQQADFHSFLKDTALVGRLITHTEPDHEFDKIVEKKYGIFLYRVSSDGVLSMSFWNNQLILPPPKTYPLGDMEEFILLSNGHYLVIKKTLHLSAYTVVAYAMIPVRSAFYLETENMPQRFVYSATAEERVRISITPTAFPVTSLSGKTLFYFENKLSGTVPYNGRLTILLRLGGLLLLLFFIHLTAESLAGRRIWKGVLFLGLTLFVLRLVVYWFPGLFNLRQFELFDPSIYGSNIVQRSLGDLLINSILFCWLVLFTWYKVHHAENRVFRLPPGMRWAVGIVSLCLLIYSTFILSSVIRSMITDSKISFDVTNFFTLDRHTVAGFIVLATLSLAYYYFTQLLFRIIFPLLRGNAWAVYFAIAFSGLLYLTIKSGDPTVLFYIPVLAWLLIYTWLVHREGLILNRIRINIAGILFWISVFSLSISAIILVENKKAEWNKRKFYAEKLAVQTDPSSENTLSIALKYLDNDFLQANFHRLADSSAGRQLRDSIITGSYSVYLTNYDTRLYAYTATGSPLFNNDATSYEALNTIVTQQSQGTAIPDVYSYETSSEKYTFITRKVIKDTAHHTLGYFFIISNPKKYRSDDLFPELFRQFRKNDLDNSLIYSYAVYSDKKLVRFSDRYPFATRLANAMIPGNKEFAGRTNGDYSELWYRPGNEKMVVIVRKKDTIIETITLFSYIFCSFLFLVFVVQLLSLLLKAIYDRKAFTRFFHFNIRNQVHSTIIFISIFSFTIIGIATISFFKSRFARSNNDKLSRTMRIMVNEMQKRNTGSDVFNSVLNLYDSVSVGSLHNLVKEMSDIHGVDVNVYDLTGNLLASSANNVYAKGVLSKKMHPVAFYHLDRLKQVAHIQRENIAGFSYTSIYAPVRDQNDNESAYLSIPYFTSETELDQEISNFIVTIINLNAFVFLIAGLIALFITNRITRSFSVMSNKMREVNLGKLNEELVWNRDDEIGDLVKEYNKMVAKLGESAEVLARTEREGAWREMARQVAHEIKNPLTPMKLSIQYLQKAINGNQPNVKDLSASVARTLVEQIDHLSRIAADFSQFANIGNISVEEFDLHDVLRSLYELYRSDPSIDFVWQPVHRQIVVQADKTQINRLFTNLFANAIEACRHGNCQLTVGEEIVNGFIRISVKDNGEGIAPEMQSRIFTPNFTTKSSGTGLGLAMCKSIVEQANGKIWFETQQGTGATFYVELPLMDS